MKIHRDDYVGVVITHANFGNISTLARCGTAYAWNCHHLFSTTFPSYYFTFLRTCIDRTVWPIFVVNGSKHPQIGDRLVVAVGLMGSKDILQIPLFRNPKVKRLLRVPQFGPQNPACYRGAKISGDPVQSVCSQGVLVVPILSSILRSWHRGSWN